MNCSCNVASIGVTKFSTGALPEPITLLFWDMKKFLYYGFRKRYKPKFNSFTIIIN